jgi:Ca2+-transporting ATPase
LPNETSCKPCYNTFIVNLKEENILLFHSETKDAVLGELSSNTESGLTAGQVSEKLAKHGYNKLREKKKKTNLQRFFDQFKDVMILILIAAAVVSFVIACAGHDPMEFFEPVLILLIVVLNAVMGMLQESKAEKALDALKNMSAPHARVLRDGEEKIIDASELVPGDIIRLEAGDFIPADARLLHSVSLKSEESALTGESVPSEKEADERIDQQAPLGDRSNMVFSGCSVTYGTATAVVTATGMDTEMGKIANLLEGESETQTPLQKKLAQLGKYLGIVALAACVIIFIVGLVSGIPVLEIFMTAVSLAVSAIPEGLPAIVTIVLSIGVQRMVKKNALIRRLPAVETLGGASVICSDKTGTLTQNRMTLVKAYLDGKTTLEDISTQNSEEVKKLLRYGTLCCDGSVVFHGTEEQHIGDPTETAIVLAAHKNGMPKDDLGKKYPRMAELPFDSDRKLMSTINLIDGKNIVIVKGAFDMMAERCIAGDIEAAKRMNEKMSQDALRVLAIGYKEIDTIPETLTSENLENGLTLMGLVGMIDPPRPEAKAAVATCRKAGIKPVMITGDHVVTASAIAKELGIMQMDDRAITGAELDAMTDTELDNQVEHISVYARVSPENKIRIVKAWQRKGQVVSMTGDGVNDAPALKAADIGCAMGITGTDVAKGAADMTLTDDNFATIVDAVKEGRGIYANIKKVVGFLLGTNIGEVITVFVAMLLWHKSPLLSMQLLWINLVTDSLPAIALGMEAVEPDIMDRKPKLKNEGIFAHGLGLRVVLQGIMFAVLTLIGFKVGENFTGTLAGGQTMAFMVLSLSQVTQAFNMRSEHSLFKIGVFSNHKLNWACLASILLVALVLFTPVGIAFGLVILPWQMYLLGLGLILVPVLLMELSKACGLIKHQH